MSSLLRTEWITEAVSLSFLTLKQRMCWVSEPQVSSLYFLWKLNVMNCRPRWIVVLRDAPAQILWYASASVSAVFVFIHSTDGYVSQHALLPSHMFVFDCVHVCLCLIVSSLALFSLSLSVSGAVPGDWSERVPREGPAGCVPHQGQQGPRGVPAGHGACQWEPHRGAGWHLTQPLQEVSDGWWGEAGGATSVGTGWICLPG